MQTSHGISQLLIIVEIWQVPERVDRDYYVPNVYVDVVLHVHVGDVGYDRFLVQLFQQDHVKHRLLFDGRVDL